MKRIIDVLLIIVLVGGVFFISGYIWGNERGKIEGVDEMYAEEFRIQQEIIEMSWKGD